MKPSEPLEAKLQWEIEKAHYIATAYDLWETGIVFLSTDLSSPLPPSPCSHPRCTHVGLSSQSLFLPLCLPRAHWSLSTWAFGHLILLVDKRQEAYCFFHASIMQEVLAGGKRAIKSKSQYQGLTKQMQPAN